MASIRNAVYPHRRNYDGSFDSICKSCFATVANAWDEAALAEQEKNHFCEPPALPMDSRGWKELTFSHPGRKQRCEDGAAKF